MTQNDIYLKHFLHLSWKLGCAIAIENDKIQKFICSRPQRRLENEEGMDEAKREEADPSLLIRDGSRKRPRGGRDHVTPLSQSQPPPPWPPF